MSKKRASNTQEDRTIHFVTSDPEKLQRTLYNSPAGYMEEMAKWFSKGDSYSHVRHNARTPSRDTIFTSISDISSDDALAQFMSAMQNKGKEIKSLRKIEKPKKEKKVQEVKPGKDNRAKRTRKSRNGYDEQGCRVAPIKEERVLKVLKKFGIDPEDSGVRIILGDMQSEYRWDYIRTKRNINYLRKLCGKGPYFDIKPKKEYKNIPGLTVGFLTNDEDVMKGMFKGYDWRDPKYVLGFSYRAPTGVMGIKLDYSSAEYVSDWLEKKGFELDGSAVMKDNELVGVIDYAITNGHRYDLYIKNQL